MQIPARILRAEENDRAGAAQRDLTTREIEQRDTILAAATNHMARHGRHAITMAAFALALRIPVGAIRRLFPDLDSLLGEILGLHLQEIARAIGDVPHDAPNRAAARRAAYLAYTRGPFGVLTPVHLLLVRDRHFLPPDELDPIEATRAAIGTALAGDDGYVALALLDLPELAQPQIEAALAAMPAPILATPPARQTITTPNPAPEPGEIRFAPTGPAPKNPGTVPVTWTPSPPDFALVHARAGPA